MMKRSLLVALMAMLLGLPMIGCAHEDDDDDDVKLKVDNDGDKRGVTIDKD